MSIDPLSSLYIPEGTTRFRMLDEVLGKALCYGCLGGHLQVVELLVSKFDFDVCATHSINGADGKPLSGMPLHFAIRANNEAAMRLLLPRTRLIDQPDGQLFML